MADQVDMAVIIPTHDRAATVRRAVDSVLVQRSSGVCVVVVDDGSTDETSDVLAAIDDDRLVVRWQDNRGRCAARNAGVAICDEPWLVFLDSDDEMLPGALNHLQAQINASECDLVVGAAVAIHEDGTERHREPSWDRARRAPWALSAGSFAMRRTLFEAIGGYCEELSHSEHSEMVFAMRSLPRQPSVGVTDRALTRVFVRPDRYDADVQYRSAVHLLDHARDELAHDRRARSMFRGIAGVSALKLGRPSEARHHLAGALIDRPRPRAALRLGAAVLPASVRQLAPRWRNESTQDGTR